MVQWTGTTGHRGTFKQHSPSRADAILLNESPLWCLFFPGIWFGVLFLSSTRGVIMFYAPEKWYKVKAILNLFWFVNILV